MFNFLKEDSKSSTTRLILLISTFSSFLLTAGMFYHVVSYKDVAWESMSVFLVSISGYMGTLLYGKVQQKKIEKNKDSNTE